MHHSLFFSTQSGEFSTRAGPELLMREKLLTLVENKFGYHPAQEFTLRFQEGSEANNRRCEANCAVSISQCFCEHVLPV